MQKIGQLLGAELYIATNDAHKVKMAKDILMRAFAKLYPVKTDEELNQEVINNLKG